MSNVEKLDDPIWEYVMVTKLTPYLPAIREWWKNYDKLNVAGTGVFDFELSDDSNTEIPPGLMIRTTSTPVRSPIKNVQIFPFIPTGYLQISSVPGGVVKMIERVCKKGFEIEEFVIIEKHNLPMLPTRQILMQFVFLRSFKHIPSTKEGKTENQLLHLLDAISIFFLLHILQDIPKYYHVFFRP